MSLNAHYPNVDVLLASLASKLCPACGGSKPRKHTFCKSCYFHLTNKMRQALWRRVGSGYEQAVATALTELCVVEPHWPSGDAP